MNRSSKLDSIPLIDYCQRDIKVIRNKARKDIRIREFIFKVLRDEKPTECELEELMWRSIKPFSVRNERTGTIKVKNYICLIEFFRNLHLYKIEKERQIQYQRSLEPWWWQRLYHYARVSPMAEEGRAPDLRWWQKLYHYDRVSPAIPTIPFKENLEVKKATNELVWWQKIFNYSKVTPVPEKEEALEVESN